MASASLGDHGGVVWVRESTVRDALQASEKKVNFVLRACEIDDGDVYHVDGADSNQALPPMGHGRLMERCLILKSSTDIQHAKMDLEKECLVVWANNADDSKLQVSASLFKNGEMMKLPVKFIEGADYLFSRNEGLVVARKLNEKCVGFVGLGSGGSPVVLELAKAGVGRFVLIDYDRLEVPNLARHSCDARDLGRLKTNALKDMILARNPLATVVTAPLDCQKDYKKVLSILKNEQCCLLVCGTDSVVSRRCLNQIALTMNVPAIFGGTLSRAACGDVLRMPAGGKPCYQCAFREVDIATLAQSASDPSRQVVQNAADAVAYDDGSVIVVSNPGLSNDILPFSQMMTKLALLELCKMDLDESEMKKTGLDLLDKDMPGNLFGWSNRREGHALKSTMPLARRTTWRLNQGNEAETWCASERSEALVDDLFCTICEDRDLSDVRMHFRHRDQAVCITFADCEGRWVLVLGQAFVETGEASLRVQFREKDAEKRLMLNLKSPPESLRTLKEGLRTQELVDLADGGERLNFPSLCQWYIIETETGCKDCDRQSHSSGKKRLLQVGTKTMGLIDGVDAIVADDSVAAATEALAHLRTTSEVDLKALQNLNTE